MKYLLTLFAVAIMLSCQTSKNSPKYSKIEYEAGVCYGFCPVYKMKISGDRTAIFEAVRYNFSKNADSQENEGNFTGTINDKDYAKLIALVDSINPKSLKSYYGNKNVSDLPTAYFTVTYQDGTIKKIEDYGKHGSPELQKIYKLFDDLKTAQTWTKVK